MSIGVQAVPIDGSGVYELPESNERCGLILYGLQDDRAPCRSAATFANKERYLLDNDPGTGAMDVAFLERGA